MADKIIIKQCNNIKEAEIEIIDKALNIKFGYNGTGKSTISKAIEYKVNGGNLAELRPYPREGEPNDETPYVSETSYNSVYVFNEEYAKNYDLYNNNDFFDDSYRVFLKTTDSEEKAKEINDMISSLQNIIKQDSSIAGLSTLLPTCLEAMNYTAGSLIKRGAIGEILKGNGYGFNKHEILKPYKEFYKGPVALAIKWAKWKENGDEFFNEESMKCPYCSKKITDIDRFNKQNEEMKKLFKKSAVETASNILNYVDECTTKDYITKQSQKKFLKYFGDISKEAEKTSEIEYLGNETFYLQTKTTYIIQFGPMSVTHDEIENLEVYLKKMLIEPKRISHFYNTKKVKEICKKINSKVNELLRNIGQLKGLFKKHESTINKLINGREEDINYFFAVAGFPYQFKIETTNENRSVAYLVPVGQKTKIDNPQKHLSWGEKNAFSLVMFMFDAVSKNADLIVLDDPISSFDKNKKFEVMRRLFSNNQKVSFKNKTILFLTHDMQPIIDFVYNNCGDTFGLKMPINAKYIENIDGSIKETPIEHDDLINVVTLTKKMYEDQSLPIYVRIVNYRRYNEITNKDFKKLEEYDVISNFIHGRPQPLKSDLQTHMSPEEINSGMCKINENMNGIGTDYDTVIEQLSTEKLIQEFGTNNDSYQKILLLRLLLERHQDIFKGLRKCYPGAYKFANETNHIENDYLFQMDPNKFFNIPEIYMTQIDSFIEENKDQLFR